MLASCHRLTLQYLLTSSVVARSILCHRSDPCPKERLALRSEAQAQKGRQDGQDGCGSRRLLRRSGYRPQITQEHTAIREGPQGRTGLKGKYILKQWRWWYGRGRELGGALRRTSPSWTAQPPSSTSSSTSGSPPSTRAEGEAGTKFGASWRGGPELLRLW